jgi:predicted RNase H-like nuclease (RuvC/YqgF family)
MTAQHADSKIIMLQRQVEDKNRQIEELERRLENVKFFAMIGIAQSRSDLEKIKDMIVKAANGDAKKPTLFLDEEEA